MSIIRIRRCNGNRAAWLIDLGGYMPSGCTSLDLHRLILRAQGWYPGALVVVDLAQ